MLWLLHVVLHTHKRTHARTHTNMPTHEANDLAIWAPDKLVDVKEKNCDAACLRHWAAFGAHQRSNETVNVVVEASRAAADAPRLSDELFGWNMEVTRHNIWSGLSAQLVP